jgi:hypothetical protein
MNKEPKFKAEELIQNEAIKIANCLHKISGGDNHYLISMQGIQTVPRCNKKIKVLYGRGDELPYFRYGEC